MRAVLTAFFVVTLAACAGSPPEASGEIGPEVYILHSAQEGDVACYLDLESVASGARGLRYAGFDVCFDAEMRVGQRVTIRSEPGRVIADSCEGEPDCAETKQVSLVVAVMPAR